MTKSLFDLMAGIFLNPVEHSDKILTRDDHFYPLAKVLLALGNMAHSATKAAPMIILSINDPRHNSTDPENDLAAILSEIWDAGEQESRGAESKYNCSDYGVRLTESGDVFLRDIQPSFSFFAALYCSEEIPLFFLTDSVRIKYVIKTVYTAAKCLCNL